MGGGAGINFELKLSGGYCLWHPKKRVFEITKCPVIESFDALDYMTGMCQVRGDLLKIINFEIETLDQADSDWLYERGGKRADQSMYFFQQADDKIEEMIFGGYGRGDIKKAMRGLTFSSDMWLDSDGGCGIRATFGVDPTEEFYHFYEDVYENWCTNTEDDMDDARENYQMREKA